ncbi:MAG: PilZ domain-containing protein [Spirochaetales bacterium]|uniref:PilZ domain-containing protein n=1 Tax=Candidatus Thalassospirochaeta sargassi TaxID=3119039 RepID=A0AAJ1IGZ9_9SPIO|nr:PilZ domain-containing protein [Spirochaetales bacterium]
MINLPLMQKVLPSIQGGSGSESTATLIVIIGVILLIVLAGRFAGGGNGSRKSSGRSGSSSSKPKKFNRRSFIRKASSFGLTKVQCNTLANLVVKYKMKNPYLVFSHSNQLDSLLRKSITEIESQVSSDQVKEAQKITIFRIKQTIERNSNRSKSFSSTGSIPNGQTIAISPASGGRFQSKINTNLKNYISATIPENQSGSQVRWKKWTPVKVFFWKRNGQGFTFDSKVTGYSVIRGVPSVLLQHSTKVKQAQQRKFRRRELSRPAYFFPVKVVPVGVGKKAKKRAIVESDRGALGTLVDISAGGCAIKSTKPVPKAGLIKLQFETGEGHSIWCFGKVINIRKAAPMGGTMHIVFTKVTHKNLNSINSFVYDY